MHYFLARDLRPVDRGDFTPHHEEADMETLWVPFADLRDAVLDGRLTDAPAGGGGAVRPGTRPGRRMTARPAAGDVLRRPRLDAGPRGRLRPVRRPHVVRRPVAAATAPPELVLDAGTGLTAA